MNEPNDHVLADGEHPRDPIPTDVSYLRTRSAVRDQRAGAPRLPLDEVSRRAAVIVDERRNRRGRRGQIETIRQLRRHGVPGYKTDVISASDVDAIDEGGYQLVHLAAGEPTAGAAIGRATAAGVPVVAADEASSRGPHLRDCGLVLSPTRAADATLAELGVSERRIARWERGIDRELFGPARYSAAAIPPAQPDRAPFNVLCTGPLDDACSLWLVAQAFLAARELDPRLQLVLVGCDRAGTGLSSALGDGATFLDARDQEQVARIYASADLFICAETGDGFGETVLEAQASGLPVLAIEGSGAAELIESGRNGCIVAADPGTLGAAIRGLARRATLRERLVTGGLLAARERTWERALIDLAIRWEHAITLGVAEVTRAA
jgi:hypothetical protein